MAGRAAGRLRLCIYFKLPASKGLESLPIGTPANHVRRHTMHINVTEQALEQVRRKSGTIAIDFISAIG